MNILSINTCFKVSDVSLYSDNCQYIAKEESALQHSVVLMSQIDDVIEKAKIKCADLDFVCVAIGPGSFTGIRIGIAVAKGICDANAKRIIPVDTLSLIAYNAVNAPDFVVVKGIANEYFVGECSDGKVVNKILLTKEEFMRRLSTHSKVATIDDLNDEGFMCVIERVEKLDMRQIALSNIENAVEPTCVEPLYLRLSQAEMQKGGANNANS